MNRSRHCAVIVTALLLGLTVACDRNVDMDPEQLTPSLQITGVFAREAFGGDTLAVRGSGFGLEGDLEVMVGDQKITIISRADDRLLILAPSKGGELILVRGSRRVSGGTVTIWSQAAADLLDSHDYRFVQIRVQSVYGEWENREFATQSVGGLIPVQFTRQNRTVSSKFWNQHLSWRECEFLLASDGKTIDTGYFRSELRDQPSKRGFGNYNVDVTIVHFRGLRFRNVGDTLIASIQGPSTASALRRLEYRSHGVYDNMPGYHYYSYGLDSLISCTDSSGIELRFVP